MLINSEIINLLIFTYIVRLFFTIITTQDMIIIQYQQTQKHQMWVQYQLSAAMGSKLAYRCHWSS